MYSQRTHTAPSPLGLVAKPGRPIAPLGDQVSYFDFSKVKNRQYDKNAFADTYDTLSLMAKYAKEQAGDMKKLADDLKSSSLYDTLQNNWNWVFNHIDYQEDELYNTIKRKWEQVEVVRKPLKTIVDQKGDCDCMTTLLSSIMLAQGIKHALRKAKYRQEDGTVGDWQHVYAVVPKNQQNPNYEDVYVLDCVLDTFNEEHPYVQKYDRIMKLVGLGNTPSTTLGSFPITGLGNATLPTLTTAKELRKGLEQIIDLSSKLESFKPFVSPIKQMLAVWYSPKARLNTAKKLSQLYSHPFYAAIHQFLLAIELKEGVAQASERVLLTSPVAEYVVSQQNGVNGLGSKVGDTAQDIINLFGQGAEIFDTIRGDGNNGGSTTQPIVTTQPTYPGYNPNYPSPYTSTPPTSGNYTALYVVGGLLAAGVLGVTIYALAK